jgi:hypothetical protein
MAGFVGSAWNLLNTENRKAPLAVFVFDDAIIITSPVGLTLTALNAANLKDMKRVHDWFAAIAPGLSSAQLAALLREVVRVTVIPTGSVITAFADKVPVSRALRVCVQTTAEGTIVFAGGGKAKKHLTAMLKTVLGPRFTDRAGTPG